MPEKVTITKSKLDSLAEVIGSKSNQNVPLTIEGMEDAVLSLITPIGTKSITKNGTHDVTNYANAKVDVPEAFVITPTYTYSNNWRTWTIDKTYDEVNAAYKAGKTIVIDAKIPYDANYYQHCGAAFYPLEGISTQEYEIIIGWYNESDNLYYLHVYKANLNNKSWFLDYENIYDRPKYLIEKTITANGVYNPNKPTDGEQEADGYSTVTVNVPSTTLQSLTVTPSTEQQVFNASSQMGDTALFTRSYYIGTSSSFPINLAIGTDYWLVLTRYNQGSGWNDSQINKVYDPVLWTATENYSYPFQNELYMRVRYNSAVNNTTSPYRYRLAVYPVASSTAYGPVTVNPIPSPNFQSKTITPSTSQQTITADSNYDGLSSVTVNAMPNGTAGTPVATKGTVSNNSITITPKVTNTTGYITGGAKTGTSVTVFASELVSGTYSITENNTYDVTNIASVVVNVPTGNITQDANGYLVLDENGSSSSNSSKSMDDPIRFFDYDGTLIASYDSVPSSPPIVPTHIGLTNGMWNYTLAEIATQFNAMGTCDIGANYDTVSGATEIDIKLQDTRLHPYLSLAINGTVTIDWGDNSISTATGTSLASRKSDIHHEYAAAGSYTIKIIKTSGTGYSLYCTDAYSLLNKNSSVINANRVYSNCIQSVRIGKDCTIGAYAFNTCYSLISVSIPSGVTRIGTYAFNSCYSLTSVSIPSSVISIDSYAFRTCYSLTSVSIPASVTSISAYVFSNCYSLTSVSIPTNITNTNTSMFSHCCSLISVSIPNKITTISIDMFSYCYSLTSVFMPSWVTTISSYAFADCCGIAEYHFESITPPTLANTNAFAGIQSDCKMYVPYSADHSILTAYQTAENWSTYASYMVEESE